MKERFTICRITTPVNVLQKAIVDDVVTITTTDTAGVVYDFRVTALNNAPSGSNTLELSGRISYCGFDSVKAKIWVRNDERVTFGIDDHDLARLEQVEIAKRNPGDYLNFGDVARMHMRKQCQYACHFVEGLFGKPNLGRGLRFRGDAGNYHAMEIHRDDAAEFVARYYTHLAAREGMSLDRYISVHGLKLPLPSAFRES